MRINPRVFFSLVLVFSACAGIQQGEIKSAVREGVGAISVIASAPIPQEVTNATQAQALARDAAIVLGQTEILNYVLEKKTHSDKSLSVAEVPSLELQQEIRGMVQGAQVTKTSWHDDRCWVTLVLQKDQLKKILKKN